MPTVLTSLRPLSVSAAVLLTGLISGYAAAEVLAPPGDLRLRHDIELLNDTRAIDTLTTAWPIAWGEIDTALQSVDISAMSLSQGLAFERLQQQARRELEIDFLTFVVDASLADDPRFIRTFEDTPREDTQLRAGVNWVSQRFTVNLQGTVVSDPVDGDEFRPDGTYVGVALGNWIVTAGWQDRWWGPGRDGSLILGTNHRPAPGITLQRNNSTPFRTKWLSWLGPWTVTTFMQILDDERAVEDALLFGVRGTVKPVQGLEISLSRTAQWCGKDRPCDFSTFTDLLLGRDNAGVNVDPEDEPGNQLGGVDIRWSLPGNIPATAYMQWIGEDGRGGGGAIGSWLRQLGIEFRGQLGEASHRTHFEVSDTICRQGGFGSSGPVPNCAYRHPIFATGYRYQQKSIGHGMDGDGRSYSVGSTLVQSAGHVWNASLRHMEINRVGVPDATHTVSPTPIDTLDIQISYERHNRFGRFLLGVGYETVEDTLTGVEDSDTSVFLRWKSQ